ncbi:hypothetical protein BU24DRAFT_397253 [Aaosphaeria arxii CBS 175.79]|uniref:peptidylprolyl isomerase n=1 Tax=Aaosphaeria arxii CBS 175.79 TaxID=1450172 RepID=A0A6A5XGG6_9PLEO|nr:uncharacterized protein BU24DRAFT_397253 [Aaosphaeria arxii CBS 175.79]KAF2012268.1 hypothetical protein BU24DRAFT_397253 [Aaosphaeria arxii CBS 175.79]
MRFLSTPLPALSLSALLITSASAQALGIQVTKAVDCQRKTESGDRISVNYKGTLESDGSTFDSSYDRGVPFTFKLGAGQVIKGWDQGLLGMCIGEGRKLIIPPSFGYGQEANGAIPAGSTLVFETELMGIQGVDPEPQPQRPTRPDTKPQGSSAAETNTDPTPSPVESKPASTSVPDVQAAQPTATDMSPMDENDNECHLLGSYALIVQGALGLLAVSSLVYKRWRETPRRPLKIWFFDVSKQVFGSVLLHLANIVMSMFSSGKFDVAAKTVAEDGQQPNPCSFYLLNLAIDTTIGIAILVVLLKLIHKGAALTPLANPPESIRSGNYGQPARATWWLKQSFLYFLGLLGMKFCVFLIFQLLPWIAWVGDWALRWTEGNTTLQITFVMFIFPLIMNAIQYWIIDGFIKDPAGNDSHYASVESDESDNESDDDAWLERHRRSRDGGDSDTERVESAPLKEANPTPVPIRKDSGKDRDYDPDTDGAQGSSRAGLKMH